MKRRDLLKNALAGAGAAAGAGSVQGAPQSASSPAQSTITTKAAVSYKPLLFDSHQNDTVVILTELIIPRTDTPGAKDAKVSEYIDLILHDGGADRRTRFVQGLGWLDGYALRQHGSPFVRLNETQQIALLKTLDGAKDPALQPGAEFFRQIKQLTVQGYYTSRAGIAELNKGGRIPEAFGCAHEGGH